MNKLERWILVLCGFSILMESFGVGVITYLWMHYICEGKHSFWGMFMISVGMGIIFSVLIPSWWKEIKEFICLLKIRR